METSCKNLVQENQGVRDLHSEDDVRTTPSSSALHILEMPDSIFLQIFSFLPFSSIGAISQVCVRWHRISYDELLWRSVFLKHFKLPSKTIMPAKASSWRFEFKRLHYHTPAVLSEERKEHKDEVLHVSFSHDGTKFATCSKDGFFKIWQCTDPVKLLFKMDMKTAFSWKFTQFSQFNETDTCLLVSGVYFGRLSTSGEIAVFNLQDGFKMQCRVTNKPYDVFGAWYDNDHLLSGTLYWTGDFNSVSAVWLSKASQEVESEVESVSMVLYRFENINSSSIRLLHVAEVEKDESMNEMVVEKDDLDLSDSTNISTRSSSVGPEESSLHSNPAAKAAAAAAYSKCACRDKVQTTYSFDHLLRKVIAEDEFDIENEDKTDNEDDDDGVDVNEMNEDRSYERYIETCESLDSTMKPDEWSAADPSTESRSPVFTSPSAPDSFSPTEFNVPTASSQQNDVMSDADDVSWVSAHSGQNFASYDDGDDMKLDFRTCGASEGLASEFCTPREELSSEFFGTRGAQASGHWESSDGHIYGHEEISDLRTVEDDTTLSDIHHTSSVDSQASASLILPSDIQRDFPQSPCPHLAESNVCPSSGLSAESSDDALMESTPSRSTTITPQRARGVGQNIGSMLARAGSCDMWDSEADFEPTRETVGNSNTNHTAATSSSSDYLLSSCPLGACGCASHSKAPRPKDNPLQPTTTGSIWKDFSPIRVPCFDNTRDVYVSGPGDLSGTSKGSSSRETSLSFQTPPIHLNLHAKQDLCGLTNSIATQTDGIQSRSSSFHSLSYMSHSSSLSPDLCHSAPKEKLLIYTWGSETYIPHKIGIKRMRCTDFSKVTKLGGEVTARRSSMLLPDVMENLHNMAGNRRDKPDVTIEMHGHIVGLSLSPDHKFLYVNCRPWPKDYIISDPQESPPLAQEVEISTIDLTTFSIVGPVLRSHRAYTHSDECFFLNLDVSEHYVASGAEDRQGYLWDRHYGVPLYRFPHRNVVNCVAINPQDPELLVTVSDDYTFKVWVSRCKAKELTERRAGSKESAV
ncbi:unnamed protein product [Lymnaea stagnalis]|uniref:F-box domain-containing protein n=1 Tax=Lymnaea stagnalis TaxID=6523 RepID=A0AAV2IH56_LYMST